MLRNFLLAAALFGAALPGAADAAGRKTLTTRQKQLLSEVAKLQGQVKGALKAAIAAQGEIAALERDRRAPGADRAAIEKALKQARAKHKMNVFAAKVGQASLDRAKASLAKAGAAQAAGKAARDRAATAKAMSWLKNPISAPKKVRGTGGVKDWRTSSTPEPDGSSPLAAYLESTRRSNAALKKMTPAQRARATAAVQASNARIHRAQASAARAAKAYSDAAADHRKALDGLKALMKNAPPLGIPATAPPRATPARAKAKAKAKKPAKTLRRATPAKAPRRLAPGRAPSAARIKAAFGKIKTPAAPPRPRPLRRPGMPLEAMSAATANYRLMNAGKAMRFDAGSSRIRPEARAKLGDVAEIMAARPGARLAIHGHAGGREPRNRRDDLAAARAEAIADALAGLGVARDRLETKGFGAGRPLSNWDTEAQDRANRRVEFLLNEGR